MGLQDYKLAENKPAIWRTVPAEVNGSKDTDLGSLFLADRN
jgi:hypothetical protein